MLRKSKLISLVIFVCGILVIAKPTYFYMKGICAQLMLDRAWNLTKRTGHSSKAWSWADTLPVARLKISSIGLNQIVLDGQINEALAFGPAIIESSLKSSNKIIAGHRDSFFKNFKKIKEGDIIELELLEENIRYRINAMFIVEPEDTKWLNPKESDMITLITCYPFNFIGEAPMRYVIIAHPSNNN